jgi:predicted DNA-binding transcriptional regulator AlpA
MTMTNRILRKAHVELLTGLSERTLRRMEAKGQFPARFPIQPGGLVMGWLEKEVTAWIEERAASREMA